MNQDLLSLLITQIWQVSMLIAIVWAVTRLFAKNRPHLAHMLWVLVLVKCLTPPVWSSPTSAFSWISADSASQTSNSFVIQPQQPPAINGRSLLEPIVVRAVPEPHHSETTSLNSLFSRPTRLTAPTPPPAATTDWPKTVLWIWIVGAGLGILATAIRFGLFLRWVRNSESVDVPEFDDAIIRLSKRLGIRKQVQIKALKTPVGPAVLGLFRPTILLPASIVLGKTPKELEPLMAHELIHIRRGDLWWAMIQTIAKSLFWFHPLVWFAAGMLTRESERSCDEETVACLGCRPATYAKGLLEVLEHKHRLRVAPALPGVRPVDITSARLERVMKLGNGIHRRTPAWVWLVLVVSCIAVLPGAELVLGQESTTTKPENGEQQETTLPSRGDDTEIPLLVSLPVVGTLFRASAIDEPKPDKASPLPSAPLLQPTSPTPTPKDGLPHYYADEPTWRVETFDIGEFISDFRKWNMTAAAGGWNMTASPLIMLGCRSRGENGDSSTPNGRQAQIATAQGVIKLGNQDATMQLVGNRLYAFGTDKDHAKITRLLNRFRRFGFRQVVVETRILKMPTDQLVDIGVEWSIAPVAANGVIDDSLIKQASHNPDNINDYSALLVGSNAWSGNSEADITDPGNHREIAAASYVEKNSPVLYATLDQKEVQTIITRMKGDIESTLFQAPTVTMFNGQNASIVSGSQRPFVVSLNRVEDKTGDTFALQPVIRVINEGIVLNLNAEIIEGEGVNLDCRLECSTVLSIDTVELPIKDAQQEPAKIQVPVVATTRIQSSLDVPPGKTLVLSCVQRKEDGETELFMAFLTCFLPDSENPDARRQANKTTPPAQPKAQEVVADGDGDLQLVRVTPGNDKPEPSTQFNIRSEEPDKGNIDYQPLVEAMESLDFATSVAGGVEFEINHSLPTIRGKNLCIHAGDEQFRITGGRGEMKVLSKDHFIFQFAGNVHFKIGESTIRADELTFDPAIGYQMSGSVVVHVDEGEDVKQECSADKIRIDIEKQILTLLGNARYSRDGDHRADIQAEFIKVNLSNDEIKSSNSIKATDEVDLFRS